tara:strand:- start:17912 stop:18574 length:663 start_codon:yes stop_codon:yes gene_type:complete
MSYLVECSEISKSFNELKILKGISLNLAHKEKYVIQGASGSGKSTLLYLLGGLDKPDAGKITYEGHDISHYSDEKLAKFRNQNIGFVFQFHFLLPSMTCLQNVLLPAQISGGEKKQVKKFALELAKLMGVDHVMHKYPYQLSGGEQQRVNIIRSLSMKPSLLLCDEPTGNLDSKNSDIVIKLLTELSSEMNSTLVIVTHDGNIASRFNNKITIEDGQIIS